MAKSRTVRARKKKLERLRNFLFGFICCAKSAVQDEIIDDIYTDKTEIVCDGKSLSPGNHDQNSCMTLPENPISPTFVDHVKRDNSLKLEQRPLSEKILDEIIMKIIAKSDVKNMQSPKMPPRAHISMKETQRHEERESNEEFARQILNETIQAIVKPIQKKTTLPPALKRSYPPVPKKNDPGLPNNTEIVKEATSEMSDGKQRFCKNRDQNRCMTLPENPVKRDILELDQKPLSEMVLDEIIMKILIKSDGKNRQNRQLSPKPRLSVNTTQKNNEKGGSSEEITGQVLNATIEGKPLPYKSLDENQRMTLPKNPKTQTFVAKDNSLEPNQRKLSERILDEIIMKILTKPYGKNGQNPHMLPIPHLTVNTTQKNNDNGISNKEFVEQILNTIIEGTMGNQVNIQKKPSRPPAPKRNDPHEPKRNDPPAPKRHDSHKPNRNDPYQPKINDQGLPDNTNQENNEMFKEIINGMIDASVGHNALGYKKPPRPPAPKRNEQTAPKRNNQGLPHNTNRENTEMIKKIISEMIGEICPQPKKMPPPRPSLPKTRDLGIVQRSTPKKRPQEEFIKQIIDDIILGVTCTINHSSLTLMRLLSLSETGISNKERPAQPKCPLSKRQWNYPSSDKQEEQHIIPKYPTPSLEEASVKVHKSKPPRPPAMRPDPAGAQTRLPMPNANQRQTKPLRPSSTRQTRPNKPQESIKPPRPIERPRQQEAYKPNKPPRPKIPPRPKDLQKPAIPSRPQLPPRPKGAQEPFMPRRPSKTPKQNETYKPNKPPRPKIPPRPKEPQKPAKPPRPQLPSRTKGPNIPPGLKRMHFEQDLEFSEKCNIKEDTPQTNKVQSYCAFHSSDDYPDELNPFADDTDDDQSSDSENVSNYETADSEIYTDDEVLVDDNYPDELNPFADDVKLEDPEVNASCETKTTDDYPKELNPFADDDDE